MSGPPRQLHEADIAWSINHFRRGGTGLGCLAVVAAVVPSAFAVHSFFAGETVYGILFALAVVMEVVTLALFCRRQYMLGAGGVTSTDVRGRQSHCWSEFRGYRRRGADLLLFFTGERPQLWVRLPEPPSPDEVEAYIRAHLPQMRASPEGVWQRGSDEGRVP